MYVLYVALYVCMYVDMYCTYTKVLHLTASQQQSDGGGGVAGERCLSLHTSPSVPRSRFNQLCLGMC